ncbi:MAG TPA: ABC transporter permease [Clostridia bacterium]|jgi:multidrug/hemolysin transport system permease protein|nr:ABC transporter permease [Clostridia bacterium]
MSGLINRNLKIYFKDPVVVSTSLFGALIVLVLYVFFLADVMTVGIEELIGSIAKPFVFTWVFSGMISIVSFTSTFGAFISIVADKVHKIEKDILSSPLPRWQISGAYLIAAVIIGIVMSVAVYILAMIYLAIIGAPASTFTFSIIIQTLGLIVLSTLSNTAILLCVALLIKTTNAFAGLTAVFSASLGFFTGTYVQIGIMPKFAQVMIKLFPLSHSALLLRKVMLKPYFDGPAFYGVPVEYVDKVKADVGFNFLVDGKILPTWVSILVIVVVFLIFSALAVLLTIKKKNKR